LTNWPMSSLHFVQPSLKSRRNQGKLDDQQKTTLSEGKPLYLKVWFLKKGEPFNASVQFNADKRYVEFLSIEELQQANEKQDIEVPKAFEEKNWYCTIWKFKEGQFM
jgi:hypothetical protein